MSTKSSFVEDTGWYGCESWTNWRSGMKKESDLSRCLDSDAFYACHGQLNAQTSGYRYCKRPGLVRRKGNYLLWTYHESDEEYYVEDSTAKRARGRPNTSWAVNTITWITITNILRKRAHINGQEFNALHSPRTCSPPCPWKCPVVSHERLKPATTASRPRCGSAEWYDELPQRRHSRRTISAFPSDHSSVQLCTWLPLLMT